MEENLKKKIRKINKHEKGITLVALVVTIIVLLILAGVSIGLVFNGNGLFSKANEAASRYNQSKENELQFLQGAEEYFDRYNSIYDGESTTGTTNPTGTASPTPEPMPTLPAVGDEPPAEGWTVGEAKGLVARDGLKVHLGEKVQYSPEQDTTGVYRIFYYDNEINSEDTSKGYFGDTLNTLYLKRDFVSNDTTLSSYTSYTPSDSGTIMRKMNPKWAKETNGSSIDLINEHCVAWLCDPKVWTKYKIEGISDYAIGSPSVEMYMKAYGVYKETDGDPDRNSKALICKIGNINGYSVGAQGSYTWNGSNESYTGDNSIEAGPNSIFMTLGSNHWWLTSPSSYSNVVIFYINGKRAIVDGSGHDGTFGVCPIIAISQ